MLIKNSHEWKRKDVISLCWIVSTSWQATEYILRSILKRRTTSHCVFTWNCRDLNEVQAQWLLICKCKQGLLKYFWRATKGGQRELKDILRGQMNTISVLCFYVFWNWPSAKHEVFGTGIGQQATTCPVEKDVRATMHQTGLLSHAVSPFWYWSNRRKWKDHMRQCQLGASINISSPAS